jgi:voltage-gated potassium channel
MERRDIVVRPAEVLMLGLSVYVLAALAAGAVLPLSHATRAVLHYADNGICAIFLADFFVRLGRAKDRAAFMRWGWIDLVSSIPMLGAVRAGRAVRAIRILRVLRGARSVRRLGTFLLRRRAEAALSAAALVSILLMIFASVAILELEAGREGANIHTAADALWWAAATIATVGYGDVYPVTPEGRMVGAFLMTTGVACFGTFTAFVASWFLAPRRISSDELAQVRGQLDAVLSTLEGMRTARQPAAPGTLPPLYVTASLRTPELPLS